MNKQYSSRGTGTTIGTANQQSVQRQGPRMAQAFQRSGAVEASAASSLGQTLNDFFGTGTKLATDALQKQKREEALRMQNQLVRQSDETYTEFASYVATEYDPDGDEDLTAVADSMFQERFGTLYEENPAMGQVAYNAFYQRARSDLHKQAIYKQTRAQTRELETLGQNIVSSVADRDTRGDVTTDNVMDLAQEAKAINPQFTEGEAIAFALKSIKEGVKDDGLDGAGYFAQLIQQDLGGKGSFIDQFPKQADELMAEVFTNANNRYTYEAAEAVKNWSQDLSGFTKNEDFQSLVELTKEVTTWENRHGSNGELKKLKGEISTQLNTVFENLRAQEAIRFLETNPNAFNYIDNKQLEKNFMPVMKKMGLGDFAQMTPEKRLQIAGVASRYYQRTGKLPDEFRTQLSYSMTDLTNPSGMKGALQFAGAMQDEARQAFFADNPGSEHFYAAYEVGRDAEELGAAGFVEMIQAHPEIIQIYKEMDLKALSGLEDPNELFTSGGLISDSVMEDIVDATGLGGLFGTIDDVDPEDVRFTPKAQTFLLNTVRLLAAQDQATRGIVIDEDYIKGKLKTVASRMASTMLSVDQVDSGSWVSANEFVIDRNGVQYRTDWGGPKGNYDGVKDEYGRQETRALPGRAVRNPMGVEENTFDNMNSAFEEFRDLMPDGNGEYSVSSAKPDTSGGRTVMLQPEGGNISFPLEIRGGTTFQLEGKNYRIPEEINSQADLADFAKSLPQGIYPIPEDRGTETVIKLKIFPHFREMGTFKDSEARRAQPNPNIARDAVEKRDEEASRHSPFNVHNEFEKKFGGG